MKRISAVLLLVALVACSSTVPMAPQKSPHFDLVSANLQLGLGAPVTIISPADGSKHKLQVGGIFRSGMYEYDANLIAVTLARAQALYDLGSAVTGIALKLDTLEEAPAVKLAATQGYGAEIILYDRQEITREALAQQLAQERGLPLIPPYDHPHIVAGLRA